VKTLYRRFPRLRVFNGIEYSAVDRFHATSSLPKTHNYASLGVVFLSVYNSTTHQG